jgi:hypothetical protein
MLHHDHPSGDRIVCFDIGGLVTTTPDVRSGQTVADHQVFHRQLEPGRRQCVQLSERES